MGLLVVPVFPAVALRRHAFCNAKKCGLHCVSGSLHCTMHCMDAQLVVRLDAGLVDGIDSLARLRGVSRSVAARSLLRDALAGPGCARCRDLKDWQLHGRAALDSEVARLRREVADLRVHPPRRVEQPVVAGPWDSDWDPLGDPEPAPVDPRAHLPAALRHLDDRGLRARGVCPEHLGELEACAHEHDYSA